MQDASPPPCTFLQAYTTLPEKNSDSNIIKNLPLLFFFFSTCLFLEIITTAITFKNSRSQATGLLSLENSKQLLCPVYLIDSHHLSGTQSISLSLPLHHSHFWQLNTRSKSSVTQTHDTVNLCSTATLQTAALKAKQKWDLAFQSIFCQKQGGREAWSSSHKEQGAESGSCAAAGRV